jgi:hypothetical protein
MHGIVLELVHHVLEVHEGVVDGLHFHLRILERRTGDEAADTAEAIDAHGSWHGFAKT